MLQAERAQNLTLSNARAFIGLGRLEDAMVQLSFVVRDQPEWAEPWALVAQVMSMKCMYDEALSATERALSLDPDHIWAQELQTGILLQLQMPGEALVAAERLVAISPMRAESYAFLAFAHAFSGQSSPALEAATRCQKLLPSRGLGHQAMCVVHLAGKHWERAEHHAKLALAMEGPIASVFHDLGVAQFEQGKVVEAVDSVARAASLDARFTPAYETMRKRKPTGLAPLPTIVAVAAGLAAIPFGRLPILFIAVAVVGVLALFAAAGSNSAAKLRPELMKPAFFVVLCIDLAIAAQQLNVI